ncbi:MAG: histidine phosphotransferase family protein [Pseudomonadota bacterium]
MAHDLAPPPVADHAAGAVPEHPALMRLGGLIAARICHDLVGPVGAIANGVDLMVEVAGEGEAEEVELVRQSTARAAALLRTLRVAFGDASPEGPAVARSQVVRELDEVITGRRVSFNVTGEDGGPLDPAVARLTSLMVLSGRLLLGLGGQVDLVFSQESSLPLRVTGEGSGASLPPRAEAWLQGSLHELPASREVELALLPRAAAAAGAKLTWSAEDARVTLCAFPRD